MCKASVLLYLSRLKSSIVWRGDLSSILSVPQAKCNQLCCLKEVSKQVNLISPREVLSMAFKALKDEKVGHLLTTQIKQNPLTF